MRTINTLLFLFFLSAISQAQTKNFIDQPYLEVTGSADTLLTPNEIFIAIRITEKDTKDRISVEELESRMYDSLKAIGIDVENKLTTSDMSSNFKQYFFRGKDIVKSKQYVLKVDDAMTAGKVFISLENTGISNTSIQKVSHSDIEIIRNGMRTKAVENAKTRAHALTKPLNQALGAAIHIADTEVYNTNQGLNGRLEEVVVVGYGVRGKAQQVMPKIEFEKIKVAANISVKFILK